MVKPLSSAKSRTSQRQKRGTLISDLALGGCLPTCVKNGIEVRHPRESSDNPRLNAFCRVAPSLRLSLLAIFLAGVLLRAADFNSRMSALVQGRRFEFLLAIYGSPNLKRALIAGSASKRKFSSTRRPHKKRQCVFSDLPRCCHFLVVFKFGQRPRVRG
jgi:hypothetical protein